MKTRAMLVILSLLFSILPPVTLTVSASGNDAAVFIATIDVCHAQGSGLSADSDSLFIIPDSIPVSTPTICEAEFVTTDIFYRFLTPFELDRPPDFSCGLS